MELNPVWTNGFTCRVADATFFTVSDTWHLWTIYCHSLSQKLQIFAPQNSWSGGLWLWWDTSNIAKELWLACNTICSKHAIWNHNDVRISLNVRGTYDSSVNSNFGTNWFFEYITRWHDQLRDISYFLHHKSELPFIANSWNWYLRRLILVAYKHEP